MTHETTGGPNARAGWRRIPRRRTLVKRLISRDPNVLGGSPVIAGTPLGTIEVRVADLIGALHYSREHPALALALTAALCPRQFAAAIAYWRANLQEIETEILEDRINRRLN
jgi:uncharacterized protein (DUF433 family)